MTSFVWQGGSGAFSSGSLWTDDTTGQTGTVPGSGDNIFIVHGGSISFSGQSVEYAAIGGPFTFDLGGGGFTINGTLDVGSGAYTVQGPGTLSIGALYEGPGTLIVTDGATYLDQFISGDTVGPEFWHSVTVEAGSTIDVSAGALETNISASGLTVDDGTVIGPVDTTALTLSSGSINGGVFASGPATITGGTITAGAGSIYLGGASNTISGASLDAGAGGIFVDGATNTISGATFTSGGSINFDPIGTGQETLQSSVIDASGNVGFGSAWTVSAAHITAANFGASNGTMIGGGTSIRSNQGSAGALVLTDAATVWAVTGSLEATNLGTGALTVEAGASLGVGANLGFEQTNGATGVNVFDGATVSVGGTLTVGNRGTITLDIDDSMVTVAGDLDVGTTGMGALSLGGGGTLTITGNLNVGSATGTGEVGGSTGAVLAGVLAVSEDSAPVLNAVGQTTTVENLNLSNATEVVANGNILVVRSSMHIGLLGGSKGSLEIQAAALAMIGDSAFGGGTVTVGDLGTGFLTISAGGQLVANLGAVIVGANSGSVGTIFVSGTLNSQTLAVGGVGMGTLFDSGTIDVFGFNIGTVGDADAGTINAGTATVSGKINTFDLSVGESGILSVVNSGKVVASYATLDPENITYVDSNSELDIGNGSVGTPGAVTVNNKIQGAGTIDASIIDNGTITASGGTLYICDNGLGTNETLSGSGTLVVAANAELVVGGSPYAFSGTIGSLADSGALSGHAFLGSTLTITGSYTNSNWGSGNSFDPDAGFDSGNTIYVFGKNASFALYSAQSGPSSGTVSQSADDPVAIQGFQSGLPSEQAIVTMTADASGLYHGSFNFVDQGSTQLTIAVETSGANITGVTAGNVTLNPTGGASSSATYNVTYNPVSAQSPGYILLKPNFDNLKPIEVSFALAAAPGGTLPLVGTNITGPADSDLTSILAALTPAGTTPTVYSVSGGAAVGAAVAGTLNVLAVTTADTGSNVTLPTGFGAGYLLAGAADLADFNGGSVLVDTATNATLSGAANDTLFGGNADATLVATTGAESLFGGTAENLFELGASTAIATSQGADTIVGSTGAATVIASGAPLYFGASGTALFNALGATATLVGGGAETVNAGTADALVFGGSGGLVFNAGSGASTVVGGTGGATLTGGSTGMLYFGTGPTTYIPGTAVDTVVGFTGSLTATGGANGTLFFTGTGGNNDVSTGTGSSTIIAFGATDLLTATGAGENVIAAAGAGETINGAQATGQNTFFAFGSGDSVVGGAGATAIESGLGNQTLVSGTGPTLFEILAGTADRAIDIQNFSAAQDYVQLQGYGAGAGAAALQTATTSGGAETMTLADGTTVTFQGVTGLTASSFI